MRNLYTRTITGVIFVALTIGSLIIHPLAFITVIYLIMLACMLEYFRITGISGMKTQTVPGMVTGSIVYLIPSFASLGMLSPKFLAVLPLLIFVFFTAELFRNKPEPLKNIAYSLFPVAYISIPLATLVLLMSPLVVQVQPHWHIVFSFFIILWSHDTFAYLTGMAVGKHKLFERISPKKTWEGSFGGIISGLLAAFILSLYFKELSLLQWFGTALIIMVTGTFGDLTESLLKRNFNAKDSGNLFPGHGGALDRFDAVLFAAPALFCYLILLNV